jgi:Phasin protein
MPEKTTNAANGMSNLVGFEAVLQMQRPAFAALAEMHGRLYESIATVNREWASFVDRRLKEDLAVSQQLAECSTLQDVYRVYAQFYQNAYSRYQSGLQEMTKLSGLIAENAIQPAARQGPTKREEAPHY